MTRPLEALLLCEGYDDRSFWQGWLERRLGFSVKQSPIDRGRHGNIRDCYTYQASAGGLLHVIACRGGDRVWSVAREKLKERSAKPIARLVVNVDVDDSTPEAIRTAIEALAGATVTRLDHGDVQLDRGTVISLVPWHVQRRDDKEALDLPGVPAKQTLERIVCTAVCRARPEWGKDVHAWLASRHDPRGPEHKALGWSYAAGWFADHGPGDYYAAVWRDPDIASELEKLMADIGAQRIIDALTSLGMAED